MKPTVLICAYSCVSESGVKNIGGEAELGWNLVKQIGRFANCHVLTHAHNKEAIEQALQKEGINNINFYYIQLPLFLSFLEKLHIGGIQIYSYLWQIKAYFVAKKLHKELKFDVFHHITYANDWMASFIGALLPVPYIRGPGGGAHRIPKAFLAEYSLIDRLKNTARNIGQQLFRLDSFFISGQQKTKALLVCNQEAFDALPKSWKTKAYFFPVNGVSEKDFQIIPLKNPEQGFSVITAGKLLKLKSVDLAIKAFKLFADHQPNAIFTIIGDGPEFSNLNHLVKELNLESKVFFKPWIPHEQLLQQIANADVFMFTSLRDGGGAVVVEAMAQAKPVVCFDIAGPGFHIKKEWGIKVKPISPKQSVGELAKALTFLHDNNALAQSIGQEAKQRAKDFYAWEKLGDKLKEIYEYVLKN